MGSVSPKAVDSAQIKQFAELYKDLETSIANATDPKEKATLENALRDLITQIQTTKQLPYVMQYIDSTQGVVQPRTQMAAGGIVTLGEGGVLSFDNGGDVTRRRTAQNVRRRSRRNVVEEEEPIRYGRGRVLGGIGAGGDPAADSLGQMGRNRQPEPEVVEATGIAGTMPDVFDVASMVENLGKPQEESEEFRMKGVTDAGKQEEPVARRGLAGLLDKIEKNADMNRLRAFLRGGAGQTSVANALAAADRGLAAEDLRQRQLDIQETDVLGRIAASRYGSELDYRAALANLRQDEREMIYKADRELEKQYLGAEQDAAKTFLANLEDDQLFNSQFMRLQQEFEGAQLAAETAALKEKYLDDYMNAYRRSGLGVSTGTFGYTAPSE